MVTFACDRCDAKMGTGSDGPRPFHVTDEKTGITIMITALRPGYQERSALVCWKCIAAIVAGDSARRPSRPRRR